MSGSRQKPRFAELRRYVLSDWSVHVDTEEKGISVLKRFVFGGIIDAEKCILLFQRHNAVLMQIKLIVRDVCDRANAISAIESASTQLWINLQSP